MTASVLSFIFVSLLSIRLSSRWGRSKSGPIWSIGSLYESRTQHDLLHGRCGDRAIGLAVHVNDHDTLLRPTLEAGGVGDRGAVGGLAIGGTCHLRLPDG